MKKNFRYAAFLLLVFVVAMSSCKKKKAAETKQDTSRVYFSIKEYALDEWSTFAHDPFAIIKTVRVNDGPTDSSYTNSDTINWAPIFKAFFETDISDTNFLGKYKYTQFPDNEDGTMNLFYEAGDDDEDLFTRKLLITADQYTKRIKGIYIETSKKDFFGERTQKLYYSPMKTIQIQTDNKPVLGKNTLTIVQYDFML